MSQRRNTHLKALVLLIGLYFAFAVTGVCASQSHEKVVNLYKNKQYYQALSEIDRIEKENSSTPILHYYKALCLQAAGRLSAAKAEYAWVSRNASSPTLRSHAQKGLNNLGGLSSVKSSTKEVASHRRQFESSRLDPRTFFFTQLYDPKYNYNAPSNTKQCGPTCLAMVFKRFGKLPPGASSSTPQELIRATRILMTGSSYDRGTMPSEVKKAAEQLDFHGEFLDDVDAVAKALDEGSMVIMAGCPFPNSYGYRVGYTPFRNGHFVLLVCRKAGQFVCNDPAYKNGPIALSSGEVNEYASFYRAKDYNYLALRPLTEEEIIEKREKEKEDKEKKEEGKKSKKSKNI